MKYHESLATSIESYVNIVVDFINQNPNQFANSLKKSTNNSNRNKKVQPPQIKIECVEDLYVLYCVVSGIDPETFGMNLFLLWSAYMRALQHLKHGAIIPRKGR